MNCLQNWIRKFMRWAVRVHQINSHSCDEKSVSLEFQVCEEEKKPWKSLFTELYTWDAVALKIHEHDYNNVLILSLPNKQVVGIFQSKQTVYVVECRYQSTTEEWTREELNNKCLQTCPVNNNNTTNAKKWGGGERERGTHWNNIYIKILLY